MAIQAGQTSPDGRYRWDGVRWVPIPVVVPPPPPPPPPAQVSPDGRWRWDGYQWVPNAATVPAAGGNPRGLVLFRGYCIVVAFVYAVIGALGLVGFALDGFDPSKLDTTPGIAAVTGLGFAYLLAYAVAAFVAVIAPRKQWAWILALILMILGVLGPTIILAVPLIVYWTMPRMRAYYEMQG